MRSDTVLAPASDATSIAHGRRAMTTLRSKVWYSDALPVFVCCILLFHSIPPIAAVIIVKKCLIESVLDDRLKQSRIISWLLSCHGPGIVVSGREDVPYEKNINNLDEVASSKLNLHGELL